jgi:hypothetical protein
MLRHIPVLAHTARGSAFPDARHLFAAWIVKPSSPDVLLAAVADAVSGTRVRPGAPPPDVEEK